MDHILKNWESTLALATKEGYKLSFSQCHYLYLLKVLKDNYSPPKEKILFNTFFFPTYMRGMFAAH